MNDTVVAYDAQASVFAARYESVSAEIVHAPLVKFVPQGENLLALDVGAGSGRDAAWLASLGFEVVAAEPAAGMRREAQLRHDSPRIRWLDDRLPGLNSVHLLGLAFDLILLSAVWMHVPPPMRARGFRKIATLLKPGGVIFVTLRDGPSAPDRPMWSASPGELEAFARTHGLAVLRSETTTDQLRRSDVRWTSMCLRLPDDGAGALPLLRGIILNDDKSSTYKLGLLRAVARVADTTPAAAMQRHDVDAVDIPLGLVALNWIRIYLPLVLAELPQAPGNKGPDGLGFAKRGFRELMEHKITGQDLRIGASFAGERAASLVRALSEVRRTIADMPANYIRFPNSDAKVFEAELVTPPRLEGELTIDMDMLGTFGKLSVPGHIWRSLQRLGSWVEPVLIAEWARLVRAYGDRMGRPTASGEIEDALAWLDPARDTELARTVAMRVLDRGQQLSCVWSGESLGQRVLDIDHCLPWSAWPCGDLWNLLPTSRRVNQHQKRDRLPSAAVLAGARESIIGWWEQAWMTDAAMRDRFEREVAAALPVGSNTSMEDVFAALEWRRLRLRQDQQVQEWLGSV
jgi:protein-L-isoaspartate O-methyltransferase